MTKLIHVAAAVIEDGNGNVFLAKRPDDKHQGGLWEFPGGKVEPDESVTEALTRELSEEVGIDVISSTPLIQVPYHYPDKSVFLDVYRVTEFSGQAHGKEGQKTEWVPLDDLDNYQFPAANKPILNAALLANHIFITPEYTSLDACIESVGLIVKRFGLKQVMLRQKQLVDSDLKDWFLALQPLSQDLGFDLILNASVALGNELKVERLHLTALRLDGLKQRSEFNGRFLSASCHSDTEISKAIDKGLDYVTLSPVQQTNSHPNDEPLGWEKATQLISETSIPVYLLGGLESDDVNKAVMSGAQGIAAISAWT